MRRKLTDRFLGTIKPPPSGRTEVPDDVGSGLVFRITEDGTCSWCVRYTPKGGKQRRITIGAYVQGSPKSGMTLAEARMRAAAITAAAREGRDLPAEEARKREEEEREAKRPQTVKALVERYVEKHCKPTQRRWQLTERLFEQHVVPYIGKRRLAELRRGDVAELLDDLQNKKGLRAQVNRVRSQIVAALNWAVQRDYMEVNPAATLKRRDVEEERKRVLSDHELKAVWRAACSLPAPSGQYVRALILTGARRDEVRCMTWSEMPDPEVAGFEGPVWVLPAHRNKGRREHAVPLSRQMVELLKSVPRFKPDAGAPVFTVDGDKPYAGTKRLKEILDRESGVTGWVLHDIRRTVRTRLADLGVKKEVAERVLNHALERVEATYNVHDYKKEKREALQRWADALDLVVGESSGNVVRLGA